MAVAKRMRIWYHDREPLEVICSPAVQVGVERQYNNSLRDLNHVEHVYYMGWLAAKKTGHEHRDFDGFLDAVIDVEAVDDVSANPTETAQPQDSS